LCSMFRLICMIFVADLDSCRLIVYNGDGMWVQWLH